VNVTPVLNPVNVISPDLPEGFAPPAAGSVGAVTTVEVPDEIDRLNAPLFPNPFPPAPTSQNRVLPLTPSPSVKAI
jgi:hypothetical protein